MTFNVLPFWIIGALCATGFGVLVLIVKRGYPEYLRRTLVYLGAANLSLGASYLARIGGRWDGRFVFDVLSSVLVVMCLSLEYRAVCGMKQRAASLFWTVAPPGLMFAICLWFAYVQRNISIQLVFFNAIDMVMMFVLAGTLLRTDGNGRAFVDALTAVAFGLMGLVTFGVVIDYVTAGQFSVEYNFNNPRSFSNNIAAIVTEGVVFPLFLLMVSERLNRDLVVKAMRDPLTGLYNRRAFEDIAFRELSGSARTGMGLALIVFDIDHLKQINDTHGHAAGDAAIMAAATALRGSLRDEDFLCRWGGDEFCALLPRARREQALGAMERVHQSFERINFRVEGKPVEITVSTGVVTDEGKPRELASLLKLADAALYEAKQGGTKPVRNGDGMRNGVSPAGARIEGRVVYVSTCHASVCCSPPSFPPPFSAQP